MELASISIQKYRAFDRRTTIPVSQFTVFTGPNNLGKSTVLRALSLLFGSGYRGRYRGTRDRVSYDYDRDYPKRYLGRPGRRWPTRIAAQLRLSDEDQVKVNQDIGVPIGDEIELSLEFRLDERIGAFRPLYEITKPEELGRRADLPRWITGQLRYIYIPATRNLEDFRRSIFSELVGGAIQSVGRSKRRISAIERFYEDVRVQISSVEDAFAEELRRFVPTVDEVQFEMSELDFNRLISLRDVEVDDGAKTSLNQKGDGFKSLFVISMLQYIARQQFGGNLLFGIEEPEAHLHSSAVYEVKNSLRGLSESFQLLITTHSPILIQRDVLSSNVVIEQTEGDDFASVAKPARRLSDIRSSLGIRPQDNMTSSEVVILVEGATEEKCLGSLLAASRPTLASPLTEGRIRVISADGASKVVPVIRALARDAASVVVLLDSDDEGRQAASVLRDSGLISEADLFMTPDRNGCRETEFEDLFEPSIYVDVVAEACGIEMSEAQFDTFREQSGNANTRVAKWSEVLEAATGASGKNWDHVQVEAKLAFASAIESKAQAVNVQDMPWLASIAGRAERYLADG